MRLIDGDALIKRLDYCVSQGLGSKIAFMFKDMVDEAPTVDAEPVIWCKDCKHLTHTPHKWYCPINRKVVYRDEFCCWAERKEENETL